MMRAVVMKVTDRHIHREKGQDQGYGRNHIFALNEYNHDNLKIINKKDVKLIKALVCKKKKR